MNTHPSILENEYIFFAVLDYCDDKTRSNCLLISSTHYKILSTDESFKWRVQCLHREKGIYHPPQKNSNMTWRDIFLYSYKRRNLWQKEKEMDDNNIDGDSDDDSKFHIQVSARFRPKRNDHGNDKGGQYHHEKKITLPLYQRLALIQMNRGLQSKKEAFEVLVEQGDWFGKDRLKEDDTRDEKGEDHHEMMNEHDNPEPNRSYHSLRGGVHLIDAEKNFAVLVDPTKGLRKFDFDHVFHESSTQGDVYTDSAMPLITEFLNGFNVSCIVYGQTGSGKTHTMYGGAHEFHFDNNTRQSTHEWGVVPRACQEIFEAIELRKKNLNINLQAKVAVSYIEIFGDSVTDLLRGGVSCGQSKVAAQRYVLDGSSEIEISSMSDAFSLLNMGEKQKRKAATAMNERSSRAHSVFIVRLEQTCLDTGVSCTSRMFLADLGGSEQLKKSQPFTSGNKEEREYNKKQRTREAVNINLGLLALKQCVEALRKKSSFIPYTDSKLTMILSSGLGGDSKTAVIVCGAQEQRHGLETIAAMKFGQTCRGISNAAKTGTNMLQELLLNINDQIADCEENIKKHERWEQKIVHRYDENGNIVETRTVTVVTGAEEYRKRLSSLIQQKCDLTGDTNDVLYNDLDHIEGFGNAHVYGLGNKVERDEIVL